ncbi:MAG: PEP-CTERM sorting domain-containing protein [Pirellulales bacterium]
MRVKNKGGVAPRDRRVDRGKVAIAAFAALLFATTAQAGVIEFVIDSSQSSLGFVERVESGGITFEISDIVSSYGEPDPSNVATAWGRVYADVSTGTSIQFLSGSRINYFNAFPYLPYRNGLGNVQAPPGGNPAMAQIGLEQKIDFDNAGPDPAVPGFGYANIFNLWHDFGTAATGATDGGPLVPFAGGTSYVPTSPLLNALMAQDGWQDLFGAVVDQIYLPEAGPGDTPFPSPFAGNNITWDGVTLTIPVNFTLTFPDDADVYHITTFGQIVAHPQTVPEPSTMLMLGCGVVGLLSYAWRARKRQAA